MSLVRHSSGEIPAETEPVNEVERDILLLLRAENRDPFRLLGPHIVEEGEHRRLVVRGFFPGAEQVFVKLEDRSDAIPARRIRPEGLFEADLPLYPHLPLSPGIYQWRVLDAGRPAHEIRDPYAFAPLLSDFDLYLMGEGTHYQKYEKMGAHPVVVDGVSGVMFAVWAPNAMRVSVVGDFNRWDGRTHPMRNRGPSGVWELFVPELAEGSVYKYEIRPMSGGPPLLKSDPYAFSVRTSSQHWLDCGPPGPPHLERYGLDGMALEE